MKLAKPSQLDNYYIQKLAIELLSIMPLTKGEWQIIVRLLRYEEENSVANKWLFLVDLYLELSDLNSDIAKKMLTFFQQTFKKNLSTTLFANSPEIADMTTNRFGEGHVTFSAYYIAQQMRNCVYAHHFKYERAMNKVPIPPKDMSNENYRYYKILKTFVTSQIDYIDDLQSTKSQELRAIIEKIKANKENYEELKSLIPHIRNICSKHREEGIQGLLKFNFLRSPRSENILDSFFGEESELNPELGKAM